MTHPLQEEHVSRYPAPLDFSSEYTPCSCRGRIDSNLSACTAGAGSSSDDWEAGALPLTQCPTGIQKPITEVLKDGKQSAVIIISAREHVSSNGLPSTLWQ